MGDDDSGLRAGRGSKDLSKDREATNEARLDRDEMKDQKHGMDHGAGILAKIGRMGE